MTLEPHSNPVALADALADALQTLDNPQVRDLVWAVASPSLLAPQTDWPRNFELPMSLEDFDRLVSADPVALQAHPGARRRVLGSYLRRCGPLP